MNCDKNDLSRIHGADDLHIAPFRVDCATTVSRSRSRLCRAI